MNLSSAQVTAKAAAEPYAVQASRSVYEAVLLAYERLEKLSGEFGDKPGFTGRFQALLDEGEIRAVIVQFSEERAGDWHEYYFHAGNLRYAFTRSHHSGGLPDNHRYFLDSTGELQRLDINDRTVVRAGDATAEQAGQEISRLARQFYAVARLEALDIPEPEAPVSLEDPATISSAEMTGSTTEIPRAVPVNLENREERPTDAILLADASAPDSLTSAAQNLAETALDAPVDESLVAEGDFAAKSARSLKAMEISMLARWAEWANRTRADKARRTPLPPDLLLDLSTPDPDAALSPAAPRDPEAEKAALDAFLSSADVLENAGEPYRATSNISIRSGPGTNHGRIGRMDNGTVILVISEAPDDPEWLIVRLKDAEVELFNEGTEQGYVYGSLLEKL